MAFPANNFKKERKLRGPHMLNIIYRPTISLQINSEEDLDPE